MAGIRQTLCFFRNLYFEEICSLTSSSWFAKISIVFAQKKNNRFVSCVLVTIKRQDLNNRPFSLVHFVFLIQIMWKYSGGLVLCFVHYKARTQAWICQHALFLTNKRKDQISWVLSQDLYWENKMNKRKRSIKASTNQESYKTNGFVALLLWLAILHISLS